MIYDLPPIVAALFVVVVVTWLFFRPRDPDAVWFSL